MSYKITAKAAAQFTTQLYASLISGEEIGGSVHSARSRLYKDKERRGRFGHAVDLEDWVVPVVYKSQDTTLSSVFFMSPEPEPEPKFVTDLSLYGRDNDILGIEMRLTWQPFMLLEGMLGVGKSHLLRYLSGWWRMTGFVKNVVFIDFDVVESAGQTSRQIVSELSPGISLETDAEYEVKLDPYGN